MQRRVGGGQAEEKVADEELEQARALFRKNGMENDEALQRFLLNQGLSMTTSSGISPCR